MPAVCANSLRRVTGLASVCRPVGSCQDFRRVPTSASRSMTPFSCRRSAASTVAGFASEPAWNRLSQPARAPLCRSRPQPALQCSRPSWITATENAGTLCAAKRDSMSAGLVSPANATRGNRPRSTWRWRARASSAVKQRQSVSFPEPLPPSSGDGPGAAISEALATLRRKSTGIARFDMPCSVPSRTARCWWAAFRRVKPAVGLLLPSWWHRNADAGEHLRWTPERHRCSGAPPRARARRRGDQGAGGSGGLWSNNASQRPCSKV